MQLPARTHTLPKNCVMCEVGRWMEAGRRLLQLNLIVHLQSQPLEPAHMCKCHVSFPLVFILPHVCGLHVSATRLSSLPGRCYYF